MGGALPGDEAEHAVAANLTGLEPNTTYHYRVSAMNFSGVTYGPDQTFATAGVPTILGESATQIGQTAATFIATVSPNLLATTYRFEYGPGGQINATGTAPAPVGQDRSPHTVSVRVAGLTPGTAYKFRVVATNPLGATAGGGTSFTTTAAPAAKPVHCKKGKVKRKGKCVKKKTPKKHRKKRAHSHSGKPKHEGGSK